MRVPRGGMEVEDQEQGLEVEEQKRRNMLRREVFITLILMI